MRPEWKRISCRFQELICYYTGSIFQVVPHDVLPIQISISLFVDENIALGYVLHYRSYVRDSKILLFERHLTIDVEISHRHGTIILTM